MPKRIKIGLAVLVLLGLLTGAFYFYSESSWITASPEFRFDLLFSLQFGIAITLCLVLIFTENAYSPLGMLNRPEEVNRYLSLLMVLCFLYSLQQVVSIVMFGVGYGRKDPLKDRWVVYSLLCLLTLVTTASSSFIMVKLYQGNELDLREICVRKKDYDEKSVRARVTQILSKYRQRNATAWREFSDYFPHLKIALKPEALKSLAFKFLISQFSLQKQLKDTSRTLKPNRACFWCSERLFGDEGYARYARKKTLFQGHWDCVWKLAISPGVGRCEISDAVSEVRNMGGTVTAEERDLLVQALAD